MSNQKITILFEARGAQGVKREVQGVGDAMNRSGISAAKLAGSMVALGYTFKRVSTSVLTASDAYTNLENRTKVFASGQDSARFKMQDTINIARKMHATLNEVGEVYQRLSMIQGGLGLSDKTVSKMAENLLIAVRLSGATAQEAEGALRQFSQGLAANRLSGQELNSVLEQTPMIAQILAKSLGVATGELRQMGKDGKLTADVLINAFGRAIPEIESKFQSFQFTVRSQMNSVVRELQLAIGEIFKLSGAASVVKSALSTISQAFQSVASSMKSMMDASPIQSILGAVGPVVVVIAGLASGFTAAGVSAAALTATLYALSRETGSGLLGSLNLTIIALAGMATGMTLAIAGVGALTIAIYAASSAMLAFNALAAQNPLLKVFSLVTIAAGAAVGAVKAVGAALDEATLREYQSTPLDELRKEAESIQKTLDRLGDNPSWGDSLRVPDLQEELANINGVIDAREREIALLQQKAAYQVKANELLQQQLITAEQFSSLELSGFSSDPGIIAEKNRKEQEEAQRAIKDIIAQTDKLLAIDLEHADNMAKINELSQRANDAKLVELAISTQISETEQRRQEEIEKRSRVQEESAQTLRDMLATLDASYAIEKEYSDSVNRVTEAFKDSYQTLEQIEQKTLILAKLEEQRLKSAQDLADRQQREDQRKQQEQQSLIALIRSSAVAGDAISSAELQRDKAVEKLKESYEKLTEQSRSQVDLAKAIASEEQKVADVRQRAADDLASQQQRLVDFIQSSAVGNNAVAKAELERDRNVQKLKESYQELTKESRKQVDLSAAINAENEKIASIKEMQHESERRASKTLEDMKVKLEKSGSFQAEYTQQVQKANEAYEASSRSLADMITRYQVLSLLEAKRASDAEKHAETQRKEAEKAEKEQKKLMEMIRSRAAGTEKIAAAESAHSQSVEELTEAYGKLTFFNRMQVDLIAAVRAEEEKLLKIKHEQAVAQQKEARSLENSLLQLRDIAAYGDQQAGALIDYERKLGGALDVWAGFSVEQRKNIKNFELMEAALDGLYNEYLDNIDEVAKLQQENQDKYLNMLGGVVAQEDDLLRAKRQQNETIGEILEGAIQTGAAFENQLLVQNAINAALEQTRNITDQIEKDRRQSILKSQQELTRAALTGNKAELLRLDTAEKTKRVYEDVNNIIEKGGTSEQVFEAMRSALQASIALTEDLDKNLTDIIRETRNSELSIEFDLNMAGAVGDPLEQARLKFERDILDLATTLGEIDNIELRIKLMPLFDKAVGSRLKAYYDERVEIATTETPESRKLREQLAVIDNLRLILAGTDEVKKAEIETQIQIRKIEADYQTLTEAQRAQLPGLAEIKRIISETSAQKFIDEQERIIENLEKIIYGSNQIKLAEIDAEANISKLREQFDKLPDAVKLEEYGTLDFGFIEAIVRANLTVKIESIKQESRNLVGSLDPTGLSQIQQKYDDLFVDLEEAKKVLNTPEDVARIDAIIKSKERELELDLAKQEHMNAMTDLNQKLIDGSLTLQDVSSGVSASMLEGFAQVGRQVFDISGHIVNLTQMAIGGLSKELATLAQTGDMNLKRMARSFVDAILQITIQLTIMLGIIAAISAMGGQGILAMLGLPSVGAQAGTTVGTGAGATAQATEFAPTNYNNFGGRLGGTFAAGGPVYGGQPILVGERGPELFVPPVSGSIKNNSTTMGMMQAQPAQVTVVNVDSSQNTLDALGSEEGEQLIINVIQRNPEILRSLG